MTPTVSIIVPVYNGEKTLARCVDSILRQDFRDFELLLVETAAMIPPVASAAMVIKVKNCW